MDFLFRSWRWGKINPRFAFLILSVGVHLFLIALFARRPDPPVLVPNLIRPDLREPIPAPAKEEILPRIPR